MTTKWTYPFVKKYLRFVRKAFEITRAGGRIKIRWSDSPMDLQAWQKAFIDSLEMNAVIFRLRTYFNRLITKYGGLDGRDRKFGPDWLIRIRRDRHRRRDIQLRTVYISLRLGDATQVRHLLVW